MSKSLSSIFNPGGKLEQVLPQYEARPQQLRMAEAVAESIHGSEPLLVEAGTGVGKSLAYLVPFLLWAVENDKRVLVATYTKTLQQQLVDHDLPVLEKALEVEFRYALCLGTQNYLCPRRFRQMRDVGLFSSRRDVEHMRSLVRWAKQTSTGMMQELDFTPGTELWGQVNRESDLCLSKNCELYGASFYWKARRQQQRAHVLIANHHLFFANLAAEGNVLPHYDAVVFDEAHSLESVAAAHLGLEVSNHSVHYLLDRIHGRRGGGLLRALPAVPVEQKNEMESLVVECHAAADALFDNALQRLHGNSSTFRVRDVEFIENLLEQPLLGLEDRLQELHKWLNRESTANVTDGANATEPPSTDPEDTVVDEINEEVGAFVGRIQNLRSQLQFFFHQTMEKSAYWVEAAYGTRTTRVTFRAAPFDVAETLRTRLFDVTSPIVLTSATLTQGDSFGFIKQQLGLDSARTLSVGSPFDFENQVLLYIARDLPEPSPARRDFEPAAIQRSLELVRSSRGRAFVLCTSHRMVRECADVFEEELTEYCVLRQGDMPRERLLEMFHEDVESVLIGTATFWQGVDVPGEALECVIITKLPFAVPDDPLVEARMEFLQAQGLNPFFNYQVPQAVLQFRQGFGRLIRHRNDFGMVAILDSRVVSKRYGEMFLNSLPECRMTSSLGEVEEFFASMRGPDCGKASKG